MPDRIKDKRVVVTHAERYMGPAICELFSAEGATVIRNVSEFRDGDEARAVVAEAGRIDVLVANFAEPAPTRAVHEILDEEWHALFDRLVHPLMRIVRAAVPQMLERKAGKIVAITSAAPLRGIPNGSAYAAARGAQNAFLRSAGLELARANIQVNAIAQNYVKNDTYYPPDFTATQRFQDHLRRNVPVQRLAESWETAELALFLASDSANFIVGQIIPFAGGWTTSTG